MNETMDMRGQLTLLLSDHTGEVVFQQKYKNRIVTSGRKLVAEMFSGQFGGAPPAAVSHMAVGSGDAAAADGDAALAAQRGGRKAISSAKLTTFNETQPSGVVQRVRVSLQAVFDFNEANDPAVPLREAGVFNADTGGVMYNRVVFEPVTKTDAFRLTLLWEVVF